MATKEGRLTSSGVASSSSDLMTEPKPDRSGKKKCIFLRNTPEPRHICGQRRWEQTHRPDTHETRPASSEVRAELTAEDIITTYDIWMDSIRVDIVEAEFYQFCDILAYDY